jgi:hypothetical protein
VSLVPTERTRNCLDGSSLFMAAPIAWSGHAFQNVAPRGTTLVPASGSPCRARRAVCYFTRMLPRVADNAKRVGRPGGINKFAYANGAADAKAAELTQVAGSKDVRLRQPFQG